MLSTISARQLDKTESEGAHISGGVSNLSFSLRGNNYIREAMHAVFLYHAIHARMDMGIINPGASVLYADISAGLLEIIEDVVLNRRKDAAERLKAEKEQDKDGAENARVSWRERATVDERLRHALVKGIVDYLEEGLAEAMSAYHHAVDVIERPLMAGMNLVGELFGSGMMFLLQVVKLRVR